MAAIVVAAGLIVGCFVGLHPVTDALVGAAGCVVLAAVTVIDFERRIVPNRIILPALAAALVLRTALDLSINWALAAVCAGGLLFIVSVVYPAGMGMGDVKLTAFLGAWLGWQSLTALVLGMFASFPVAVTILALRGRAARKVGLPFAPFLALGGVLALFAGPAIVRWYHG